MFDFRFECVNYAPNPIRIFNFLKYQLLLLRPALIYLYQIITKPLTLTDMPEQQSPGLSYSPHNKKKKCFLTFFPKVPTFLIMFFPTLNYFIQVQTIQNWSHRFIFDEYVNEQTSYSVVNRTVHMQVVGTQQFN